ncbi:GTP cyclohydrolase FolE2 [Oceanobacter mangrovi]|uniref:GTP cyclohydrolase FolE2 n=1 Tax=Oceanobacter mangrovi TaxID=2862510 RepID=UPI001C8D6F0D|nr:GTP cyclohydrolase FolE2 [Oceanobacter mangrovi]
MNARLPDVSVSDSAPIPASLSQVGMDAIDLPITLADSSSRLQLRPYSNARVRATVDLPLPHIKGIHMSRLYRLLMPFGDDRRLTPAALQPLLSDMISSHQDCGSSAAELVFEFEILLRKPALKSAEMSGWSAYPVKLAARLEDGRYQLRSRVSVGYSSTCPCSAALARQLISERFKVDFDESANGITSADVVNWLQQNASLATPHSQRSRADVEVEIDPLATDFGLPQLIAQIEQALQTPLQTAVKRADEQAFAELNGSNLMFVEDAARRIKSALAPDYQHLCIDVCHLESLHPHDAVASVRS